MRTRKHIELDEKVGLKLTATDRSLILDNALYCKLKQRRVVRDTPIHEPVLLTLDDWTDIVCGFMIEVDHTGDTTRKMKLSRVIAKINKFLDQYPDDLGPELKVFPAADGTNAKGERP